MNSKAAITVTVQLFYNKQFMAALDASGNVAYFTFAKFGFILGYVTITKHHKTYRVHVDTIYMFTPSMGIH